MHQELFKHLGPKGLAWLADFFTRVVNEKRLPKACRRAKVIAFMGGATSGLWGTMPPTFGTRGVQGGGSIKMIFASTADSLYSVLYK